VTLSGLADRQGVLTRILLDAAGTMAVRDGAAPPAIMGG
jgi:hypothetical protein